MLESRKVGKKESYHALKFALILCVSQVQLVLGALNTAPMFCNSLSRAPATVCAVVLPIANGFGTCWATLWVDTGLSCMCIMCYSQCTNVAAICPFNASISSICLDHFELVSQPHSDRHVGRRTPWQEEIQVDHTEAHARHGCFMRRCP